MAFDPYQYIMIVFCDTLAVALTDWMQVNMQDTYLINALEPPHSGILPINLPLSFAAHSITCFLTVLFILLRAGPRVLVSFINRISIDYVLLSISLLRYL